MKQTAGKCPLWQGVILYEPHRRLRDALTGCGPLAPTDRSEEQLPLRQFQGSDKMLTHKGCYEERSQARFISSHLGQTDWKRSCFLTRWLRQRRQDRLRPHPRAPKVCSWGFAPFQLRGTELLTLRLRQGGPFLSDCTHLAESRKVLASPLMGAHPQRSRGAGLGWRESLLWMCTAGPEGEKAVGYRVEEAYLVLWNTFIFGWWAPVKRPAFSGGSGRSMNVVGGGKDFGVISAT